MEIRFFFKSEKELLRNAINDIWAENHILSRNEELLDYMFMYHLEDTIFASKEEINFLGAWIEDNLVGFIGVLPFSINIEGKLENGCALTNWIVLDKYRDSGAGLALMKKIQEFSPKLILSLGINDNVAKIYKAMKWSVLKETPRWIGLVRKKETINCMLEGKAEPLRYWEEINEVPLQTNLIVEQVTDLNSKLWDEFYWSNFARSTIGIARNSEFLKWRYLKYPFFKYNTFVTKDDKGNYTGILIFRIEEVLENKKIGRIVEFIACDQDSYITLANILVNYDRSILFYDFYCFSGVSSWGVEAVGFKKVLKSQMDTYVLPSRFQPLDLVVTDLMAAMYVDPKIMKKLNLINEHSWYVTKGDSDQDRPN